MRNKYLFCFIALILVASVCFADQTTDDLTNQYRSAPLFFGQLITTVVWSAAYLAIYTAALIISLSYLKLFGGFDTEFLTWIGLLWGGGLVINGVAYHYIHNPRTWVVALCTIPLIYLWNLLISTRSFADLTFSDAARVGIVIALLGAPWFHNTWGFETPPNVKPYKFDTRAVTVPQVAVLVPWDTAAR